MKKKEYLRKKSSCIKNTHIYKKEANEKESRIIIIIKIYNTFIGSTSKEEKIPVRVKKEETHGFKLN